MPIRKPCKGRTRKTCKQASRSCKHIKKTMRSRAYCRAAGSTRKNRH